MTFVATVGGRSERVEVSGRDGRYRLTIGDAVWEVDARLAPAGIYSLLVAGLSYVADVTVSGRRVSVEVEGESYEVEVEDATRHAIRTGGGAHAARGATVTAPLPGRIAAVLVAPGTAVAAGDTLVVIEAMKMENELKATAAGTVTEVRVAAGQTVNGGEVLVVLA